MFNLLQDVFDAHGGLARWQTLDRVDAFIVSGGLLYDLKGQPRDNTPRHIQVGLRDVSTVLQPFGAPDQRMIFTTDRTSIERGDGTVLATTTAARASFHGHGLTTPWTPLQRAYFSGYALWTYLNSPFLLAIPGARLRPIESLTHAGQALTGIEATFPATLPTHSRTQRFYFGPDLLLRRHDYRVDVAGWLPATQYLDDYVEADGTRVPLVRRAYRRDAHGATVWDELMVSMRFSDIRFQQRRADRPPTTWPASTPMSMVSP